MFEKIGRIAFTWSRKQYLWTNVYGMARTLMALSTALTLALNRTEIFFRPAAGINSTPLCNRTFSIFCTVPPDYTYLAIVKWLCVIILLIVASGWRPQLTGPLHWWISYSLQVSALTIDGGEQTAAVLTLLLLPITLTDPRKWHWSKPSTSKPGQGRVYLSLIAIVAFALIRVQVAIIYLNGAFAKLSDPEWVDGTAVYYYMRDPLLGMPSAIWDMSKYALTTNLVVIPTWGTIIAEFLLFAALVAPKKYWKPFLIIGVTMHTIFAVVIGLYSFSIIMDGALILFLRPTEQMYIFPRLSTGWRLIRNKLPLQSKSIGT